MANADFMELPVVNGLFESDPSLKLRPFPKIAEIDALMPEPDLLTRAYSAALTEAVIRQRADILRAALTSRFGPYWTEEGVAGRLQVVSYPWTQARLVLCDRKPLFNIYPTQVALDGPRQGIATPHFIFPNEP